LITSHSEETISISHSETIDVLELYWEE